MIPCQLRQTDPSGHPSTAPNHRSQFGQVPLQTGYCDHPQNFTLAELRWRIDWPDGGEAVDWIGLAAPFLNVWLRYDQWQSYRQTLFEGRPQDE
ncbi:MAG TPA: hypothetical protein PKD54_14870 [Pirellulaceae bacterium]|nr:hypothetical protein [Pirellulaceae bacterium]